MTHLNKWLCFKTK